MTARWLSKRGSEPSDGTNNNDGDAVEASTSAYWHEGTITERDVVWAYRLFLGRDPESREAIDSKLMQLETLEELRAHFLSSDEYRASNRGVDPEREAQGLPIPSGELIHLVADAPDPLWYLRGGRKAADSITTSLARVGKRIQEFESLLDFGCGCGRVIRRWHDLGGPALHGSDLNPKLIDWCSANLPFARFAVNGLEPPLAYQEGYFDFVYALSVFTHLNEELQDGWVEELARVIRPGGVLLITVHGNHYRDRLDTELRERFDSGQMVVTEIGAPGSNRFGAYHPLSYLLQGTFAEHFRLIDFVDRGARGNPFQDLVLFERAP